MSNVVKFMGPIFSLTMCLSMLTLCVYSIFWTKWPLIMPCTTGLMAILFGVQVAYDVKRVWWPLLTGKPVS